MTLAVTQNVAKVLGRTTADGQVTAEHAEAQARPRGDFSVTQVVAQCLIKRQTTTSRNEPLFTQVLSQVLLSYSPVFGWIDMFVDTEFPFDISFHSIGATRFQTDVSQVDSGGDQRIARWDQPLMEYDVAYGVRTMEQLHGLMSFFRAMRGKLYSFKYFDHTDFSSTIAVATEARRAPAISCTDQPLGTGDGATTTFQLQKVYATPDAALLFHRPIYKPKAGSVLVGVDGQPWSHFTVDFGTGRVTFTSDLVVEKQPLTMSFVNSTQWKVSGSAGLFAGFATGDRVVTAGWLSPLNNIAEADRMTVADVGSDKSYVVVNAPAVGYGAAEAGTKARFYRHPAPPAGKVLTAGFQFFVPVRFDTDRLPVTLEEYGVGSASDVKLVEVRPWDE